jgi:hypothetical protein
MRAAGSVARAAGRCRELSCGYATNQVNLAAFRQHSDTQTAGMHTLRPLSLPHQCTLLMHSTLAEAGSACRLRYGTWLSADALRGLPLRAPRGRPSAT